VQGDNNMEMDSMVYNIETQKGLTKALIPTRERSFYIPKKVRKFQRTSILLIGAGSLPVIWIRLTLLSK
jgi:hypothetical protein